MGGHAVPSGFTILRFAEPDLPDVAYLEHLTSALYFDKKSEVDRYLLAMERLSIISARPNETNGILSAIIDDLTGGLLRRDMRRAVTRSGHRPLPSPQPCP